MKKSSKIHLSRTQSILFLCWRPLHSPTFICHSTNYILALFNYLSPLSLTQPKKMNKSSEIYLSCTQSILFLCWPPLDSPTRTNTAPSALLGTPIWLDRPRHIFPTNHKSWRGGTLSKCLHMDLSVWTVIDKKRMCAAILEFPPYQKTNQPALIIAIFTSNTRLDCSIKVAIFTTNKLEIGSILKYGGCTFWT